MSLTTITNKIFGKNLKSLYSKFFILVLTVFWHFFFLSRVFDVHIILYVDI